MSNEQFEKWKNGFINQNFENNRNFDISFKLLRKPEPHAPKLNIWTSRPVNSIKTMKHL